RFNAERSTLNKQLSTGAQQARTSSRTKCNRITFGAVPSSKWQFTASRTCCRRVSNVSASVQMDGPKERAVKPHSTAFSIRKMISFMFYSSKRPKTLRDSPLIRKNALGRHTACRGRNRIVSQQYALDLSTVFAYFLIFTSSFCLLPLLKSF